MGLDYEVLRIRGNTALFEEGDPGDAAYLLRRGSIELSKHNGGRRRVLAVLRAPGMFGEMALVMGDHRRTASARAVEDCELVPIKNSAFQAFLDESPLMMQTAMGLLVQRLKDCTSRLIQTPSVEEGVVHALAMLVEHGVSDIDEGLFVQETSFLLGRRPEDVRLRLEMLVGKGILKRREDAFRGVVVGVVKKHNFRVVAEIALESTDEKRSDD